MRALFLVLVIANLAFFSYARWLRAPDAGPEIIPRLQVSPEKIKVIGVGPQSRAGNAARPRLAEICLEWGLLAGAEVARAENLQPKLRRCLMCADDFQSHHMGERVCPDCKSTSTWRQTGIAI